MKILKFKNKSLNIFLEYSYRYKWYMIAVILLSTIASAMSALPAWLSKYLVDDVLVKQSKNKFYLILIAVFVTTLIKVVASYYSNIASNYVTETIKREIKIDIFSHREAALPA